MSLYALNDLEPNDGDLNGEVGTTPVDGPTVVNERLFVPTVVDEAFA